jgi:hypothetical protein
MGHTGQAGCRYVTQVQVQVQHRRRYSEAQRKTARGVAAQPCIRGERSGAVSASTCYVRTVCYAVLHRRPAGKWRVELGLGPAPGARTNCEAGERGAHRSRHYIYIFFNKQWVGGGCVVLAASSAQRFAPRPPWIFFFCAPLG